jgi:hypothetical protein
LLGQYRLGEIEEWPVVLLDVHQHVLGVLLVQVVGMVSLVVFNLLGVLHLVLNTMVGGSIALSWRGATDHSLLFVVFVLLQLDRNGPLVVVPVVIFVVVASIGVMIWCVLTPL